jgi:hypothetical protein
MAGYTYKTVNRVGCTFKVCQLDLAVSLPALDEHID